MMGASRGDEMAAARVEAALDDVAQVEAALHSLAELRRAPVDRGLEVAVQGRRVALDRVGRDLARDGNVAAAWQGLRAWRDGSAGLFEEALAYLEGALTREHSVAADVCELADALLDELSDLTLVPWSGFTVLASGEYVDRLVGVVRIRFPEASVWTLPMAAHEFGHAAVSHWGRDSLSEALSAARRALPSGPAARAHTEEYAADAFATWTTGPVFPMACSQLRFEPTAASEADHAHPSALYRMHVMLRVLDHLGERAGPLASAPTDDLRTEWMDALTTAKSPASQVPASTATSLDALAAALCEWLEARLPSGAAFAGWFSRQSLESSLTSSAGDQGDQAVDTSPWEVIGAAWAWRRASSADAYAIRDVGDNAKRMCRTLLEKRRASRG